MADPYPSYSLLPLWRDLWINPYSQTTREYPLGQLLLSLADEVEKEARKYGRDWRLRETDRENLIDVSTQLSVFLVETGNALIAQVPTVRFLFDDHPVQQISTGQIILRYANAIVGKAVAFCSLHQPMHYNFRIKMRKMLFSAADVFETAARALLNPLNPFDLPENLEGDEVVFAAPESVRVPNSVNITKKKHVAEKQKNEGLVDECELGDAANFTNACDSPYTQPPDVSTSLNKKKVIENHIGNEENRRDVIDVNIVNAKTCTAVSSPVPPPKIARANDNDVISPENARNGREETCGRRSRSRTSQNNKNTQGQQRYSLRNRQ